MSLLKEYLTTGKPEALSQKLKEQGIKELQKAGKVTLTKDGEIYRFDLPFNSTKKDQNTKVDINNLDSAVEEELSLFAADLINQIRQQFGTDPVKVTKGAIKIAHEVARTSQNLLVMIFTNLLRLQKSRKLSTTTYTLCFTGTLMLVGGTQNSWFVINQSHLCHLSNM